MIAKKLITQVIGNTLAQSIGKIASTGFSFISIVLLTRYLGVVDYGNYTLVFSYLAFFSLIADFGLQYIAVKEIAAGEEKINQLYGTYFILRVLLVLLSSTLAIFFLIFPPYSPHLKLGILIGIAAVGLSGINGYFNTIFQARIRLDLLTVLDLIGRFFSVVSIVLFVYLKLNFYYIVGSVLVGNLAGLIFGIFMLSKSVQVNFDFSLAKKLLFLSIPVGITGLLSTLYFKIDTIILSILKGPTEVGVYSLSYKILENITIFWFFYVATVYPLLAKFRNQNREKYIRLLKSSILLAIGTSVPIIIISYILAPFMIRFLGGEKFVQSIEALRILVFSLSFIFINTLLYNFYILESFNWVIIIGMLFSLIFNIFLNIIYIPRYSYIASSYITVFSEIILLISYILGFYFFYRRKIKNA